VDSSSPWILGAAKQPGRNNTVTNPGGLVPACARRRVAEAGRATSTSWLPRGGAARDKPVARPHTCIQGER